MVKRIKFLCVFLSLIVIGLLVGTITHVNATSITYVNRISENTEIDTTNITYFIDKDKITFDNFRSTPTTWGSVSYNASPTLVDKGNVNKSSQHHYVYNGAYLAVNTSTYSYNGGISYVFKDAAIDVTGKTYDVKVNIDISSAGAIAYSNASVKRAVTICISGWRGNDRDDGVGISDKTNFMFMTYPTLTSSQQYIGQSYPSTRSFCESDITVTIQDSSGNKVNGTFFYMMTDLDTLNDNLNNRVSGSKYCEAVKFITEPKKLYLATDTTGILENSKITTDGNNRFYSSGGKDYPNITEEEQITNANLTSVLAELESGSKMRWSGALCNSVVFYGFDLWKGSVNVEHKVDPAYDNTILQTSTPVVSNVKYNTGYSTSKGNFNGYKFSKMSDTSAPASGKVINKTALVTYYYLPPGSVRVIHKSIDGTILKNWEYVKQNVEDGTSYTTNQGTFTNYKFSKMDSSSAATTGTVTAGQTKDVIYLYELNVGNVDVTYKTTDGNALEATSYVKQNAVEGTSYTTTQKTFVDYHFVKMDSSSASANGTVIANTTLHVIYLYEHDKGSVRVRHIDTSGNPVNVSDSPQNWKWVFQDVDTQTPYTTSRVTPDKSSRGFSYTLKTTPSNANGKVVLGVTDVTWVYEENGSVDVVYLDEKGNIIENTSKVKDDVSAGTPYNTAQKSFDGYTFKEIRSDSADPNGTVQSGKTLHVIYVYNRDTGLANIYKSTNRVDVDDTYYFRNSKFTVYADSDCTIIARDYDSGALLSNLSLNGNSTNKFRLATGTYYLKETVKDDWFEELQPISFAINKNDDKTIEFENILKNGKGKVQKNY